MSHWSEEDEAREREEPISRGQWVLAVLVFLLLLLSTVIDSIGVPR